MKKRVFSLLAALALILSPPHLVETSRQRLLPERRLPPQQLPQLLRMTAKRTT